MTNTETPATPFRIGDLVTVDNLADSHPNYTWYIEDMDREHIGHVDLQGYSTLPWSDITQPAFRQGWCLYSELRRPTLAQLVALENL